MSKSVDLKNLYKHLLELTSEGVYRYTFDEGKILFANYGLIKILDLTCKPEEILGKRLEDLIEYTEKVGTIRSKLAQESEIHNFEYHFRTLTGKDKWVMHDSFLNHDPQTGVQFVDAIVKDITPIKVAQFAAEEEKERLRVTLASIGDAVIVTDTNGRVTSINKIAEQLTGWDMSSALGKPLQQVFNIINEDNEEPCENPVDKVIETGSIVGLANHTALISKDGTRRSIADSGSPIRTVAGELIGVVMVFRDVTEQMKAHRELAESKAFLEAVISQSPAGILIATAPDAHVILANKASLQIRGPASAKLTDISVESATNWAVYHTDGVTPYAAEDMPLPQAAIYSKSCKNKEFIIKRESGELRWLSVNAGPIYDSDGNLIAGIVVFADITKRKNAEKAQAKVLKELENSNEELESIVYVSSHDLKSPLVNIEGFTVELGRNIATISDVLEKAEDLRQARKNLELTMTQEIPENFEFIHKNVVKISRLMEQLIKLSHLRREPLHISTVNADYAMKRALNTLRFKIKASNAEVIAEPLPNCHADTIQLEQVFVYLIDNAIKFRKQSTRCSIKISGRIENGRTIYCIQDNGIGIDPAYHEKVFEIFHQLDPKSETGGFGIGLTAVKRILIRLGSTIWIESQPGDGSRFFISLPEN